MRNDITRLLINVFSLTTLMYLEYSALGSIRKYSAKAAKIINGTAIHKMIQDKGKMIKFAATY